MMKAAILAGSMLTVSAAVAFGVISAAMFLIIREDRESRLREAPHER